MIGLCRIEKGIEIKDIADLALRLDSLFRGGGFKITISIALFIPRPHTPFQWNAQMEKEAALEDFHDLIRVLKTRRNITVKFHDPEMSELEGVIARGDRKLSGVIERAFRKGARFDGWSESFKPGIWKEAFAENSIDPGFYMIERNTECNLPWEIIDIGINKRYLLKERERGLQKTMTPGCSADCRNFCGSCDFKRIKPRFAADSGTGIKIDKKFLNNIMITNDPAFICRILYSKTGLMKYIGPVDLEEMLERAFIRANIPVVFTRGFNPHVRVEMGWALPVGLESLYEVAEFEVSKKIPAAKLLREINSELPKGIKIIKLKLIKFPYPKFTKLCREHFACFSFDAGIMRDEILSKAGLMGEYVKAGTKGGKAVNLKDYLNELLLSDGRVKITFNQKEGGARIRDYISYLTGYDSRKMAILDPIVESRYITNGEKTINLFDIMENIL